MAVGCNIEQSNTTIDCSARTPDRLYLFACHLEWQRNADIRAYEELVRALDHHDEETRELAEQLLSRRSPRPKRVIAGQEVQP